MIRNPSSVVCASLLSFLLMMMMVTGAEIGSPVSLLNCPKTGEIPWRFPHPTDCRRLYICKDGRAEEFLCTDDRVFNSTLQLCVPRKGDKCEIDLNRHSLEFCPPRQSDELVLLPHMIDCQLFYICDNGFPKLRKCPDGLHFNPQIKVCDYPYRAGCTAGFHMKILHPRERRR